MIAGRAERTKRRLRAARRAGAAALLAILLSAKIGRPAESEVAPVRVVYDAPSTCPDAERSKRRFEIGRPASARAIAQRCRGRSWSRSGRPIAVGAARSS